MTVVGIIANPASGKDIRRLVAHAATIDNRGKVSIVRCALIGLAEAGGDGLELAKEIYAGALEHVEELCAPYATVIDIDPQKLPSAQSVKGWTSAQFVSALRHNPRDPAYNPHLRQLLHVGYKIAAKMGNRYLEALKRHEAVVARNVTENLFERHLKPLFLGRA